MHLAGNSPEATRTRPLVREIAGRTLNTKNELYILPADEKEYNRLDKQHRIILLLVGNLYAAAEQVQEALAPAPGIQRSVLDLGSGAGDWAIGMANEFPHANVVGIDLAPRTLHHTPPNCRFETGDFTLGLEHYYDNFDVVHARAIANGVKDYVSLIHKAAKCVKPGGVLLFTEGDLVLAGAHKEDVEEVTGATAEPGQSWCARVCAELRRSNQSRGATMFSGRKLEKWLKECSDLTDVGYEIKWVPIGPWEEGATPEETERLRTMGALHRENMKEFARSVKPALISAGYEQKMAEQLIANVDRELDQMGVHMYSRYHFTWARRAVRRADGPDPTYVARQEAGTEASSQ